jgi:hypothetical protein
VYNILKSPLAYGDYYGNNNTKMYQNLAFMSWHSDYDVKFSDEEIQLVIALVSLREKLTKRGECNNYTSDGIYGDLYYPTFQEWFDKWIDTYDKQVAERFVLIKHFLDKNNPSKAASDSIADMLSVGITKEKLPSSDNSLITCFNKSL